MKTEREIQLVASTFAQAARHQREMPIDSDAYHEGEFLTVWGNALDWVLEQPRNRANSEAVIRLAERLAVAAELIARTEQDTMRAT